MNELHVFKSRVFAAGLLLFVGIAAIFMFAGCDKLRNINWEEVKIDTAQICNCISLQDSLKNTEWKLIGLVDALTGETELIDSSQYHPLGCRFELTFLDTKSSDTNYNMLSGFGICNRLTGGYYINSITCSIDIKIGQATLVYCSYYDFNEEEYMDIVKKTQSFSVKNDTLRLYYNNEQNYLLFKSR